MHRREVTTLNTGVKHGAEYQRGVSWQSPQTPRLVGLLQKKYTNDVRKPF